MREARVVTSRVHMFGGILLALALACLITLSARSEAQQEDPEGDPTLGFALEEGIPPPGANIACDPGEEHPYPVVLVHGTFETMAQNWAEVSPLLKAQGYCVFALNYGSEGEGQDARGMGLGPIQESAADLDEFVDAVLEETGAQRVQLVGHSQGGMMPRFWIKNLGGAPLVEDLVGFASSNYGTNLNSSGDGSSDLPDAPGLCRACDQQNADSTFIKKLNEGDDTPGNGSFTQIATDDDEIIIPFTNTFLKGERLTENIVVQNYNNGALVTHQNIYLDPVAQGFMLDALANPGPADDPKGDNEGGDDGGTNPNACTIRGTNSNDDLRGTNARDVICGLGGNDRIRALGGDDVVRGGPGNDQIFGGSGDDGLEGQQGNDALYGGPGRDQLDGGPGRDSTRQ